MSLTKDTKAIYIVCMLLCTSNTCTSTTEAPEPSPVPTAPTPGPTSAVAPVSGPRVFDVMDYGAVADGRTENSRAFLATWEAAISYVGISSFVVPEGEFLLGPITLSGRKYMESSPKVVIKGCLKALPVVAFTDRSWITFQYLHGLTVSGGGTVDGQGANSWKLACPEKRKCRLRPTSMSLFGINKTVIHNIHLINSKSFHMKIDNSIGVHLYNLSITAPDDSPNTDGIHVGRSTNIRITGSVIGVGDDCISIGEGSNNISINGIFCGPGHGISVGSLGGNPNGTKVKNIHVNNCTLSGTTNGIRIKTWPGSSALEASNFTFEDIVMKNVESPIIIDQKYCPSKDCTEKPSQVKISNITYRNIRGTSSTKLAVNLVCSPDFPCQNIKLSNIDLAYQNPTEEVSSLCDHVKVTTSGVQKPPPCQDSH